MMKLKSLDAQTQPVAAPALPNETGQWRLWHDFAENCAKTPDAPALRVGGLSLTYRQLHAKAVGIALDISRAETADAHSVTAIYADRSLDSYAGVLAALMVGHAYVPLNPKFPDDRNATILALSQASFVVCSPAAAAKMAEIADPSGPRIISQAKSSDANPPVPRHLDWRAYILFTSGSTGQPKGVPISHANVAAYLTAANQVADFRRTDRFSQNFDLTFDLSVHDMFLCWRAGAELVVPSETDLENPAGYVLRDGVTCWFSVPSLAQKMSLQGALEPGALDQLRLSLFCGEALPLALARKWQAATRQRVENWYGPTEATIACMRFVLPDPDVELHSHLDLTPIGTCLPGMQALVLDENKAQVAPGGIGELLVAGPQVAQGYLNSPEKTADAFVTIAGRPGIYYRTGDRVKVGDHGALQFVDRTDNQIKIRGYRVEIGEIEAVLRRLTNGCNAMVTPLPLKSPNPTALSASVEGYAGDLAGLLAQVKFALPAYMVPTAIRNFAEFPKNASGKADRGQVGQIVGQVAAQTPVLDNTKVRKQLMAMARRINPALTSAAIVAAPDLMEAGLDSIAFTEFVLDIEKTFGIALDQTKVARMAEMSIKRLTFFVKRMVGADVKPGNLRKKAEPLIEIAPPVPVKTPVAVQAVKTPVALKVVKKRKPTVKYRSRRTIECVRNFPAFVQQAKHPLALFFGSSGTVAAISNEDIEAAALSAGTPITVANLGMSALSNRGTVELIDYVCDIVSKSGKTVAFAGYELDPMQLSELPTGREIEMVKAFLVGEYVMTDLEANTDPLIRWDAATGGQIIRTNVNAPLAPQEEPNPANWSQKREREVVDTYMGKVKFVPAEVEIWLQGARMLQGLAKTTAAFVHPILNMQANAQTKGDPGHRYFTLLDEIDHSCKIPMIDFSAFAYDPADFRDFNHVNLASGRRKMSVNLAQTLLKMIQG